MHHILKALGSALFLACAAPALAALAYLPLAAFGTDLFAAEIPSPTSLLFLLLGFAAAAYFLGAVPAFVAGLLLPTLQNHLPPIAASGLTGVLGAGAYFATFGAHLLAGPNVMTSGWLNGLTAFIGTAAAAFIHTWRHPPSAA